MQPTEGPRMSRSVLLAAFPSTMLSIAGASTDAEAGDPARPPMKISIKVEDKTLMATLEDSAPSRDFVSLLPLTLTLKGDAATEKISDL
jgi:hypothetical protein